MEELDLDFLKTPPKRGHSQVRIATPCAHQELDVRFGKKKSSCRKLEMAQNIAKVDELLQEIDKLRKQNSNLQESLKDFQQTAQQVQTLYGKERHDHAKAKENLERLEREYNKMDVDLTNKTMMNEQMKARLAEYDGRPINFDNLVVKYVRMMKKLEGEDVLRYSPDKDLVERLKEYCATMKLKIAPISSPKKGNKSKGNKIKTHEMFVQCDLLKEQEQTCPNCSNKPKMHDQNIQCLMASPPPPPTATSQDQSTQFSASKEQDCPKCNNKPKQKHQNTQCTTTTTTTTKRDQASQYISTMITRQTNTEKIKQKHVQTMFPEPQKIPAIDDILNVYSRWSNIRSVSPLLESPPSSRVKKNQNKKSINIGTCTMLCNIRRKIDYLPPNQNNNIKQEIVTPSASPTPNSNPHTATHRSRMNSLSNHVAANNQYANSILNLFNANTNSALGQLSSNAFNELWQIFGKMLLSLLQTSNAGIANTHQNSALNQQQFLDWLLDLYMSSQPPNTSTTETQTLEPMDNSNDSRRSPLRFNDTSMLSTDVVRPEAQKVVSARANCGVGESVEPLRVDPLRDLPHHNIHQQRATISPIPTSISHDLLENYSQDSNSMDTELQQIHNASNSSQDHTASNMSNLTEEDNNTLKQQTKSSNKSKTKHKLLEQIQELIPELNLDKKKRKSLKRLLKTKNHRKKTFETRKSKSPKDSTNFQSSVVILPNDNIPNDETEETAVDFLKTFGAGAQEENISETEKIFLEQSSMKITEKTKEEFTFIKPSTSLPRTKLTAGNRKDSTKRKKSKICRNIANKYQLLFGESDSEMEELEADVKNSKPVIKTKLNLREEEEEEPYKECNYFDTNVNWSNADIVNSTNFTQTQFSEDNNSTKSNIPNESYHFTMREAQEQQFSLPVLPTPVFEMSDDRSPERFSIPDLPTPLLRKLECEHLPQLDSFENNTETCDPQHAEVDIERDLEISSDDNSCKEDETEIKHNLVKKQIEVPAANFKQPSTATDKSFTIENSIKCLPNLNEDDDDHVVNFTTSAMDNSDFEKDLELSSDNESQRELSNVPMLYGSDFEKDLELSSDNESLINENLLYDQTTEKEAQKSDHELVNECGKSVDSKTSTDSDEGQIYGQIIEQEKQESDHDQIKNEICKTFDSKTPTESNGEWISNEKEETELRSNRLTQTKERGIQGEANYPLKLKGNEENSSNSQEETDNTFKDNKMSTQDVKSPESGLSKTETKESSLCCSVITINDSTVINETLNKTELTKIPKGEEKCTLKLSSYEETNSNLLEEEDNNLKFNKNLSHELTKANIIKFSPCQLENSNCNKNNTINQEDSNENSLCWSVITINDSTIKDETLNKTKLTKTTETQSFKEGESEVKSSGLKQLKLLDLNNSKEVKISHSTSKEKETSENVVKNCDRFFEISENEHHFNKTEINLTNLQRNPNDLDKDVFKLNKNHGSNISLDTEDDTDYNDHELMIDEEINDSFTKESQAELDETLNSSNISTLLNSSLYNEVLSESLNPIVDDLLKNDVVENVLVGASSENKTQKRGRKRKSESSAESLLPSKRSQRLRAKQMILEESLNLSKTPIKLGKYTKMNKNLNNVQLKEEKTKTKEAIGIVSENEMTSSLEMGFFCERLREDVKEIKKIGVQIEKSVDACDNSHNITKISIDINDLSAKEETTMELKPASTTFNYQHTTKSTDFNFTYTDSPQSPPPSLETQNENLVIIPSEHLASLTPQQTNQTLFDVLISSYRGDNQKHTLESFSTKESQRQQNILTQYHRHFTSYCYSEMELDPNCMAVHLINKLLSICPNYGLIQKALIAVAQNAEGSNVKETELPSIIQEMPPRHLSKCLQRLFVVLRHLITKNASFCKDLIDKIEVLLFNWKQMENLSLQATLNLTQLYLMACKVQEYEEMPKHPARLFIAKCLYFYLQKSILMIHEVLMWYPTVLPHREDKTYDRSDALISVIQQILMSTKYDMDKADLRSKSLLSKLRYEYHFEPFKPALEEVINVLVEKLKNSKFYNISLAFGLLCKRLGVPRTQQLILVQHLLPLANEYYSLALKTTEYDKRIAVLLEIISMIVKPFPVDDTDTKIYFNEFSRYLNTFQRQLIQEAALCSILRLQRFDLEYCYNLLRHFKPTYDLNTHTQAMLKTFFYRRPLNYWKNLKSKNCN